MGMLPTLLTLPGATSTTAAAAATTNLTSFDPWEEAAAGGGGGEEVRSWQGRTQGSGQDIIGECDPILFANTSDATTADQFPRLSICHHSADYGQLPTSRLASPRHQPPESIIPRLRFLS
ncbi:hypothetical protein Pmani_033177 [Petrolisthes manimaculis]|uniref:Secreted protein n=1 Tax=Petrolisthes manimaculis TaxID=1843537 RepID=A0AAE1NRG3_9EUCA|nr:hypothetical protein Pmani_033177 [Petrolisthes manimaculis]